MNDVVKLQFIVHQGQEDTSPVIILCAYRCRFRWPPVSRLLRMLSTAS